MTDRSPQNFALYSRPAPFQAIAAASTVVANRPAFIHKLEFRCVALYPRVQELRLELGLSSIGFPSVTSETSTSTHRERNG
jgi:hypothetical protein